MFLCKTIQFFFVKILTILWINVNFDCIMLSDGQFSYIPFLFSRLNDLNRRIDIDVIPILVLRRIVSIQVILRRTQNLEILFQKLWDPDLASPLCSCANAKARA